MSYAGYADNAADLVTGMHSSMDWGQGNITAGVSDALYGDNNYSPQAPSGVLLSGASSTATTAY